MYGPSVTHHRRFLIRLLWQVARPWVSANAYSDIETSTEAETNWPVQRHYD